MPDALLARLHEDLLGLRADDALRSLSSTLRGIDFSSNDYLGLSCDPVLRERFARRLVASHLPFGAGASRLLGGTHAIHLKTEATIAAWRGSEAALLFNSGYDANSGIIAAIARSCDTIYADKHVHASIIDGLWLSPAKKRYFQHNDLTHLEDHLKRRDADDEGQAFIVVESLYSMDGDSPDAIGLLDLAARYGAALIVDEAHATGTLGTLGRGLFADCERQGIPLMSIYTAGKALAGTGAFVCCTSVVKDWLVNHCRTFMFTTAMSPYAALWIDEALIYQSERDDLRTLLSLRASMLREKLAALGLNAGRGDSFIVPLILGDNERALAWSERLHNLGFDVRAVRPPTVAKGSSRLRISLNAKASDAEFAALYEVIGDIAESER